jgi:hypothetical protein
MKRRFWNSRKTIKQQEEYPEENLIHTEKNKVKIRFPEKKLAQEVDLKTINKEDIYLI